MHEKLLFNTHPQLTHRLCTGFIAGYFRANFTQVMHCTLHSERNNPYQTWVTFVTHSEDTQSQCHESRGCPASVLVFVFVCSSGGYAGGCAAAAPLRLLRRLRGVQGGFERPPVSHVSGVCLSSNPLKKAWELEKQRRRAQHLGELDARRLARRAQCAPYIEATDRRWERRAGGVAADMLAWAEAREAEAALRRQIGRDNLLAELQREVTDRALFEAVRFGSRGRR